MLIKPLLYSLSWFVSPQKEWLCLNCQTQRALQGGLDDRGKMVQPSPTPAKPETSITPALKKPESKTVPPSQDKTPPKPQPAPTATKAIPTGVPSQDTPKAIPEAEIKEVLPAKAEKLVSEAEKKPSEALKVEPMLQDTAGSQELVPENITVADKVEAKKTDKHEVVSIETPSSPVTDKTVAISLGSAVPELSAPEDISEELKPDNHIKMPGQTTSFQQIESQQETKAVPAAELKDVTDTTDGDASIQVTELSTKGYEM